MTTRNMSPGDLEFLLTSRVANIRAEREERAARRARARSRNARQHPRGRARTKATGLFAAMTFVVISAVSAWGSHGGSFIDLTDPLSQETHNDAIFTQGGIGSGTGNFDPFLTLSPGGSADTESGYNICTMPVFGFTPPAPGCPAAQFDEQTGGDRTHELLASVIPVVSVGGTDYREFFLDSNDSGSDPWMAITVIKIFLDNQVNLSNYVPATETFGNDDLTTATLAWDLDGDGNQTILMNTQGLESGSGVSDISVLVPDDLFPADCFYGSTTCDTYVYFYTEAGDPALDTGDDRNWNTTAGFEEWRIELLPVVNVSKTVDISLTRTFPWDVTKSADVETIDLFAGDTATINWTVTATVGTPVDSDLTVSGEIAILNPTGSGFPIEAIPATIVDVDDVLTLGGVSTAATVTCPGGLPQALAAGATLTCTYTASPSSADNGTNTATLTIETSEAGDTQAYSDTETVDFALATVDEVDECIAVTDDNATPADASDDLLLDAELCQDESPGVYNFSTDVGPFDVGDCGQTTITNFAFTETNDTATPDSASDFVTVNCHELAVSKTAEESFGIEYDWTILKSVDPTSLDLFSGDSADVTWTVDVFRDDGTPSGWRVTGTITINNPGPLAADDVAVADVVSGVGAATVTCPGGLTTVDIPAASSANCTYEATLPNADTRTNTATATLFGQDYTGTAPVDFTGVTPTETDATATVTDDRGPLNEAVTDDDQFTYPEPFTCPDDDGTHNNTAVVTEEDTLESDSDSASVTVNCHQLIVTKDANTSLDRDYDWTISKTRVIVSGEDDGDGDPTTLTLSTGQVYTVTFEATVDSTGSTDDNWAVEGTITVDNPAPIPAEDVVVTDLITPGDIGADVDCDPSTVGPQNVVDIPAEGSVDCSYGAVLPDDADRTNTATATLLGEEYTGTADILFDENTTVTEIDECIDVSDDRGTPADTSDDLFLGTVCIGDPLPHTFSYTTDIGPFEVCGQFTFINTASFVTTDDANDTDESGSSSYTITIDVPCPEGCTLTWGYWKTHNESFPGGAPPDETWLLLDANGDAIFQAELEPFFISGMTYFEVMSTPPKGNAYFQLAHQYIAAQLNMLAGADGSAIATQFATATTLLQTNTDVFIGTLKGNNALRQQFISLAGTLAAYNEGTIGPGHCDEDGSASTGLRTPFSQVVLSRARGASLS